MPRLLIITAAFGEGHNSAARNLALALDSLGAETRVCDPCMLAAPYSTQFFSHSYRYITTHLPKVWEKVYRSTDQCDFSRQRVPLLRKPERYLADLVEDFRPDAIVCTYPIYPYFLARTFAETGKPVPVFTVVTDSIEINASWLRAPTDRWLVTDPATKSAMENAGLPAEKIVVTGFAVHPAFAELEPVECADCCEPFRILYFPMAKRPFIRRHCRAMLDASPNVKLTVVMGKSTRLLYSRAREIQLEYPGRVRLVGWTKRVPQYLNRHHLVVGKAGGATVHEAIAARCPMLIHHLVPGQEEGNLKLLEKIGGGDLANTPELLTEKISGMLANRGTGWRAMKQALATHGSNSGAIDGARFILQEISKLTVK